MVIAFITGIVLWTLPEYTLHRFLGHVHKGRNFFKKEHLQHHAKANYFAPAIKKAALAVMVSTAMLLVLGLFMPLSIAIAFVAGFTGMFCLYEVTHYRYHSADPVAAPFIILRKHHFYHHFHNPKTNFGVTTRIWDRVFGTFVYVEKVSVPARMAMQWLLSGNEIKQHYTSHFQLRASK